MHKDKVYFRRSDLSGWKAARRKPSSRRSDSRRTKSSATGIMTTMGRDAIFRYVLTGLLVAAGFGVWETSRHALARESEGGKGPVEFQVESKTARPGVFRALYNRRRQVTRQVREHLQLTMLAMGFAITIGVATGVILTRLEKFATAVLGIASVIQTVPSLALLALMIPLLGIGLPPAVMALFLYALLPIMRNTYTAIREVEDTIIEVGQAMGMTNLQILWRVEIPLCVSVVMAGIRTSTVICVGIATLCTFIGAGGLGTSIMEGMQNRGSTLIMVGVLPAIALALLLDGFMATIQKLLTPKGLRLQQ
ncbi:MAG: ABC transporter permease [Planctomycetota bacterium]